MLSEARRSAPTAMPACGDLSSRELPRAAPPSPSTRFEANLAQGNEPQRRWPPKSGAPAAWLWHPNPPVAGVDQPPAASGAARRGAAEAVDPKIERDVPAARRR